MARQPKDPDPAAAFMRPHQVSKLLGITPNTLRSWSKAGKAPMPVVFDSGATLYSKAEIDAWLEERMAARPPPDKPARGRGRPRLTDEQRADRLAARRAKMAADRKALRPMPKRADLTPEQLAALRVPEYKRARIDWMYGIVEPPKKPSPG
jgi:predicted DNA-binding transcriptional regulator AlpA